MKFSELMEHVRTWLEREERVSYRALKLEFALTEDVLDALKEELIQAKRVAVDENGKVLERRKAASVKCEKDKVRVY